MFFFFSSDRILLVSFMIVMSGRDVLKRSPAIRTKPTFFSMHLFIAYLKLSMPNFFSSSSLQPPMWQSAKWATFINIEKERKLINLLHRKIYILVFIHV